MASKSRITCAEIVEHLRGQILKGRLRAGQRLPSHADLVADTGASIMTLQRAVDQLSEEGFVCSRPRLGRFVAERPPHLFDFALIYPSHPDVRRQHWSNYWKVLHDEAQRIARADTGKRLHVFYDVHADEGSAGYRKLMDTVNRSQLAGLIHPENPYKFAGTELARSTKVAQVSVSVQRDRRTGIRGVSADNDSFLHRACERLAQRGCRRVALLLTVGFCRDELIEVEGEDAYIMRIAAKYGLQLQPNHILFVSPVIHRGTRRITDLLMQQPERRRPDGLIFGDDHMAQSVGEGLLDAGVAVGRDVNVVGLANFPMIPDCPIKVDWLGVDTGRILNTCLDVLGRIRAGKPVEDVTLLPMVFEEQFRQERAMVVARESVGAVS